jgi:hypothetical protein
VATATPASETPEIPTGTAVLATSVPTATAPAQPEGVATVSVDEAGLATFTSPELGIRFTYLAELDGIGFNTEVQGDKVFVSAEGTDVTSGQYVQVFAKEPGQTLEEAIRAQLLAGYATEDCLVVSAPMVNAQAPATYTFAQIDVPRLPGDGLPELSAKAEKCPAGYVGINGLAYFVADSQHPDQFAFFSIGQYAILSANQVPWQNTFEFLE